MAKVLIADAVIFGVLAAWVWVQQAYAAFARRHPELGPFRREGAGCGSGGCGCSGKRCDPRESTPAPRTQRFDVPALASAPEVPLEQFASYPSLGEKL